MGTVIFDPARKLPKTSIMNSAIAIFLGLLAVANARAPYKDCGSKGKITAIDINGCTKAPCLLPEGKACETGHITPACPLTPSKEHAYDIKLPVSSWYPSLRLNVKWQLQDENGNDLVCIIFPAMLK